MQPVSFNSFFTTVFLIVVFLNSTPSKSLAATVAHDNHAIQPAIAYIGLHGMLMFGTADTLFAAHLPMYHPPHNVQTIIRFKFEDAGVGAWIKARVADSDHASPSVWTLVPEPFDLLKLDPALTSPIQYLVVDVYRGHFERGGERVFEGQTIRIDAVEVFRPLPLDVGTTQGESQIIDMHYCLLSPNLDADTQFLFKLLGTRPEADHLVRIEGALNVASGCLTLKVPKIRLSASEAELRAVLLSRYKENPSNTNIELQSLYLETNELK